MSKNESEKKERTFTSDCPSPNSIKLNIPMTNSPNPLKAINSPLDDADNLGHIKFSPDNNKNSFTEKPIPKPKFSFDGNDSINLNFQPNKTSSPIINYFTGLNQPQQAGVYSQENEMYSQLSPLSRGLNENFFPNDEKMKELSLYNNEPADKEDENEDEDGRGSYILSFNEDDMHIKTLDPLENEPEKAEAEIPKTDDFKSIIFNKNERKLSSDSGAQEKSVDYSFSYKFFPLQNIQAATNSKPSDYYATHDKEENLVKFYNNHYNNSNYSPIINQIQTSNENITNYSEDYQINNLSNFENQNMSLFSSEPYNSNYLLKNLPTSSFSNKNNESNYQEPYKYNNQNENIYKNLYENYTKSNVNNPSDEGININMNQNIIPNKYMDNTSNQFTEKYFVQKSNPSKKVKRINPNTYINESYEYLSNNVLPLGRDQIGCRFLQKKIDDEPQIAISHLFPAVKKYAYPLINDPFGNYLVQKVLSYLNDQELLQFMQILENNIFDIGSNTHGTRVIQHLINFLRTKELIEYFLKIIYPFVIPLLKELNGTHIIQKFNTDYPIYGQKIIELIINNCEDLATHKHGCCVLQKFLNSKEKFPKNMLMYKLTQCSGKLVVDQFGNYVIQSVIKLNNKELIGKIVDQMLPNILELSKHKYSSNVVEKCFDYGDQLTLNKLITALNDKYKVSQLILDEHGNYVIQKILSHSGFNIQNEIFKIIAGLIPKIKAMPFGDKLISVLLNDYPQSANFFFPNSTKKKGSKMDM